MKFRAIRAAAALVTIEVMLTLLTALSIGGGQRQPLRSLIPTAWWFPVTLVELGVVLIVVPMLLGAAVARLPGRSLLWLIPVVGVPFLYRYFERIRYGEVLDSLIGAGPVAIVVVVVAAWLGRVITSALTQPTGQSAN